MRQRDLDVATILELESELQTLKDKVKAFIKADDDYVMNEIDTDTYDRAFNKLKKLIK